ncbi:MULTISPECIES: hypothetical protein [unclassified Staphylococcus]|uniref:hypothetical protein n=1 Tax=unclassified Staphylococcus TaxID=91994 RepID=UPI00122E8FBF|nr:MULTISPECIES: hypothetical protein [unclassified Staphylococcus]KAA2274661.1 hypothetical protein F1592_08430 [Staphylococcus sp. GDX7P312P]KAA2278450.1 hypothetical protein F1591_12175 [Staphylococcus sp. GDX7P459A]
MPEESKYVLRHEWMSSNGEIYKKINENDKKNIEALSDLKTKVETQTTLQQRTYEEQKETNSNIKNLTQVMTNVGNEMTDIKYKVMSHDEKIESIQGTIETKQKGSVQIIVALIGLAGSLVGAAFAFAQIFF